MPADLPKPPPPPKPPKPARPRKGGAQMLAKRLATTVREAHGVDQASTLDMSEEIAAPRGYIGTSNVALERALGSPGLPLGRIVEISGWEGSGKSTMLDQVLSKCQEEGGVAVLADTERTRFLPYMRQLGIDPEAMVWVGGQTTELMFEEIETLVRKAASLNAIAWYDALKEAGMKPGKLQTYKYSIYDPHNTAKNAKPVASFVFARWGREQAAALLAYQKKHGLTPTSVRDAASREALRPCVFYGDTEAEKAEAYAAWKKGEDHPLVDLADRPIVIGWDSVAGTPTEKELESSARASNPAAAAKVIKLNLRRLIQLLADEAVCFVLVNQRYEKINQGGSSWGQKQGARGPSETYGGSAIKYHTTVRIEVERVGQIYQNSTSKERGDPPMGQIVRIRVAKNKVNNPFHRETFGLIYGRGADNAWAIYEDLKARGIIRMSGSWSQFTDPTILGEKNKNFRGWMELANMMSEDRTLWVKLRAIYMEGR